MKFIADLHLHSKYSVATSRQADLAHLHLWAVIKGIDLVATSDFTHPKWFAELKDQLEPDGTGLFRLKPGVRKTAAREAADWGLRDRDVRFILSSEISSIYGKNGRTRKIHNLALFDSFGAVERYSKKLARLANIAYDGRPITGIDARDVLSLALDSAAGNGSADGAMFIPAHIWTPWFSLFGSRSGFDSIEECFGDLTPQITALETGLSSDPPMNWMVSALDRFNLVSNSDAHSPQNLGREANLFDTDLSFAAIRTALRDKASPGFLGTLEFFPEEGKYHNDGHRDCKVNIPPDEALKNGNNCPVCRRPLTIGVLHRVLELADRQYGARPADAKKFESLVPLKEIIVDSYGSLSPKKTEEVYKHMVRGLGPEFAILRDAAIPEIAKISNDVIAEGVRRLREGRIGRVPGYDGEFGTVSIFTPEERDRLMDQDQLLPIVAARKKSSSEKKKISGTPGKKGVKKKPAEPDPAQQAVIARAVWPAAVTAGPGTGKTFVLTEKIRAAVRLDPALQDRFAAVTFTRKAADELRQRLALPSEWIGTIHSVCLRILRMKDPDLAVIAPAEAELILSSALGISGAADEQARISLLKATLSPDERPADRILSLYDGYLRANKLVDFDDIVTEACSLVAGDPGTRSVLTEKLDCLFVDEFQDVNPAQYGFILELARLLGGRLFVIGDPDQSIYGFRGAAAGIFERLRSDLPSTSFFALDRNFRSSSVVVRASNRLIGNENKTGPSEEREGRIHTAVFGSELAEAVFIAKTVSERIGGRDMIESARHRGSGLGLNDFGVLVRTWRQTRVIAGCLEKEGLPFRTRDGSGLVRSPEARTAVNMAKLLLSPDDRMARLFFTKGGFPFDEIFAKFSGQKERYLAGAGSFLEDLDAAADFKDRLAFDELLSVAKEHPSLAEFLDVMLYRDPSEVESGRRVVPREAVSVMTMHAAKGLEFPVVFIPGMEEGLVPYLKDSRPDPGRIGEERRLFYVAMTRARTDLYLTRSLERGRAGAPVRTRPSRFLDEAGPEFFSALRQKKIRPKNPQLELFP